jgi:hypothetical protein
VESVSRVPLENMEFKEAIQLCAGCENMATLIGKTKRPRIPKSQEQKILELEQKVKLLEKQKAYLEKQVENSDKKAIIFDMMIDLAEKEYHIPIRKNYKPG